MDALEVGSRHRDETGARRPDREDHGVEVAAQLVETLGVDVGRDVKDDPRARHDVEASVEDALLEFELGDAVAQEPAHGVGPLEDLDVVTGAHQLRGGGESRGPRSDDGHAPSARFGRDALHGHP